MRGRDLSALRIDHVAVACLPIWLGAASFGQVCDTWQTHGSLWPSARAQAGMAYDVARGRCVMYGGDDQGGDRRTWQWDGRSWITAPASGPGGQWHAMAYDSGRSVVVLFGGYPNSGDTWEWAGST